MSSTFKYIFKSLPTVGLLLITTLLVSCKDMFDYSPYAINFTEDDTGVNIINLGKINHLTENDTLRIAFTGDSHNFFDELEGFVKKVNNLPETDFVIHVGDVADFGLPAQYLWTNDCLKKLEKPYLVLIGNHDLVGNGQEAYKAMYGELNFSFVYREIKFIFLNTNSLEFANNGKVPDLNWLSHQLAPEDTFSRAIVICHVPPDDADFDAALQTEFYETLARYNNVMMLVHGHQHHFEFYYPTADSIPYINVYGAEHRMMTYIKIYRNEFYLENMAF